MAASDDLEGSSRPRPANHRETDTRAGELALAAFEKAGGDVSRSDVVEAIAALGEHAPALFPLATADLDLLPDVLRRPLGLSDDDDSMRERFLEATHDLDEDGPELFKRLRRLRHRAMVRIALREVFRLADVDETSSELASLATGVCEAALRACRRGVERKHGAILDTAGRPVPLIILGMGKLGGHELNLGSDIDLLFFYGTDEGTVGDGSLSVHEAVTRIVRRTTKAIEDATEDGFCFRVDLRLRPEGTHGPLANSLASAERYYESFGRTWERAAMLRARPIAGDLSFGHELLAALRPFVYRRTVDPRIAVEMTDLVRRSRRELRSDPERDVKLCRGGIREAEFFLQTLQLLWGGIHPQLQTQSTTHALRKLRAHGLLGHRESMTLGSDWALLRSVEHRIHMRSSHQTHDLPVAGPDRDRFARSLGFPGGRDFDLAFGATKERVAKLFDSLVEGVPAVEDAALERLIDLVTSGASADVVAEAAAQTLPLQDPVEAASHLRRLARHAGSPLGPVGRERAPDLARLLLSETRHVAHADSAIRYLADFFARVRGEWSYDRLLLDEPAIARRLIGLFGASATLSATLIGHPDLMDEVVSLRGQMPSDTEIRELHTEIVSEASRPPLGLPDPEEFVGRLRRAKREVTLRIGLSYVAEEEELTAIQARLTTLADAQIAAALGYASIEAERRFGAPTTGESHPATIVVVGLGKLGSREMGFGSDLDLVFHHSAEGETVGGSEGRPIENTEFFARVAQRTLSLLSRPHGEGPGYDTDTRLRANGVRGPLVQSLAAFNRYHASHAAPWERQALIRARVVAGDSDFGALLSERMDAAAFGHGAVPGEALAAMRARIETELSGERSDRYHAKTGYGGLVDIEFVAQWLSQRYGDDRSLRNGHTLVAIRALRTAGYLEKNDADTLTGAFRFFRELELSIKLLEEHREPVLVPAGPLAERIARRLRMRVRDGVEPGRVLVDTWIRHATAVRSIFERIVAPVGLPAPWHAP